MKILAVKPDSPDRRVVAEAVGVLRQGGIVAFPTETVYGLAVDANNPAAVEGLYRAKGRDANKACAFLLPDAAAVARHVPSMPSFARRLADAFWPGPVTLVVPGGSGLLVGLRLPSDPLPRALASAFGSPLLQTSANRSGEPAAINGAAVAKTLGESVQMILDAGRVARGLPSTVVHCQERVFTILREGAVPAGEIHRAASDLFLVACTANLCRSPLAEALFRHRAAERLQCDPEDVVRHGFRFGSFGISALPGHPATAESIHVGREQGVDLSPHRSSIWSIALLKQARRVYCLARNHAEFLAPYFADRPDDLVSLSPEGKEIADPYGQPLKAYRRACEAIDKAVGARLDEMLGEMMEAEASA